MKRARLAAPAEWTEHAACAEIGDPDLFFPGKDEDVNRSAVKVPWQYRTTRRICAGCPVRTECLELALATESANNRAGMWGGLTPKERAQVAARRLVS